MNKKIGLPFKTNIFTVIPIFLLILVNLLIAFNVKSSFYVYLVVVGLILGFYVLRRTKFFSLWIISVTSIFWGSALLVTISGILAVFSIPIREWVLYIPSLVLIPLLIKYPIDIKGLEIKPKRDGWIMMFFTVVSLISHVFSVRDFIAPILHDPISHATWAKQIYDTGLINYFYSPGLHILAALGKMADGDFISRYILILTNIFNALIFIPVYLFIRSYFKDRKFALLTAVLFLIAKYPSAFFWTMGKNAFVMGIAFMFLLFFISSIKMDRIKKIIIINLLILLVILIHYPIAFIALIGVASILFSKALIERLIYFLPGSLIGLIWGFLKVKYQVQSIQDRVANFQGINLTFENIIAFTKTIFYQMTGGVYYSFSLGEFLSVTGFLGLLFMLLFAFKKKRYFWFLFFLVANIAFMYIIEFMDILSPLHIVYKTQLLVLFIFIYIGSAFLFSKVFYPYIKSHFKNVDKLVYTLSIVLVIFVGYSKFIRIREIQKEHNMVSSQDVAVFKWINKNLDNTDDGVTILNNAKRWDDARANIIYASDGGAWIPVFTDYQIAMPFTDFASKKTHYNYGIYETFINEEQSCKDIEELLSEGIGYYYKASKGIFSGQYIPKESNNNFKILYSVGSARIYRILPCK